MMLNKKICRRCYELWYTQEKQKLNSHHYVRSLESFDKLWTNFKLCICPHCDAGMFMRIDCNPTKDCAYILEQTVSN